MSEPAYIPHFADRLIAAVRAKHTPVLVGLDPRQEGLPPGFVSGQGAHALARAYQSFCCEVIDVVAPLVPAVKPQSAFFEQLGPPGCEALAETIRYAASRGLLVILDGKRNDIGTTAQAYADAYLGPRGQSAWGADALTISPYLGDDSLTPFVRIAQERGAGIFVLVKTSNPGGGRFQDLVIDSLPLYRHVAAFVKGLSDTSVGENGYGIVGAVAGATYPEQLAELRQAMPSTWLLIPGYGAQGGTAKDCAAAFDERGLGAIVNNSRGIIFAHARAPYSERFGPTRWQEAVGAATRDMIAELRAETSAGRLVP
ncbi:MAG TPA: orotidine-5'-phosphate decarboxylase [Pirellulaceae bacterium]|nr:orotidine-5'-phosphate decarboxylase [Pirellulaceae bacterium]